MTKQQMLERALRRILKNVPLEKRPQAERELVVKIRRWQLKVENTSRVPKTIDTAAPIKKLLIGFTVAGMLSYCVAHKDLFRTAHYKPKVTNFDGKLIPIPRPFKSRLV